MWGTIYLIHFSEPICVGHPTMHYLGWALNAQARLVEHRAGRGARLTQVAVERGIAFDIVRVWPGSRELERQIKRRKYAPRICPICSGEHALRRCVVNVNQLALPFDEDFPEPRPLKMDSYEFFMLRCWRLSAASVAIDTDLSRLDDLL